MNDKQKFTLDVISSIDDDVLEKNLKKRFELWFKKGKRKSTRWMPIVAAAACLCLLISSLLWFLPTPGPTPGPGPDDPVQDTRQIPIYLGMTVSNEAPSVDQALIPPEYPTFSFLSAASTILPPYDSLLEDKETAPGQNKPGGDEKDSPDIVFGETYYAMKNEDIYIHIHLSNPDEFEILSFTLNGKKYSSNMFEYGSDLETLILKYNVGDVNGLQEYTIDAIKYIDGEKIKDVRMEGDQTVKVYVNDENDLLQFNATLSFTTLTIAPTKQILTLALYEGDTLLRTLSPTDTEIADLPFDKRLILKATYSDGTQTREAQHIFDTQALSKGLIIEDGIIRGIGSCTDTVLYINDPIGPAAFSGIKSILKVYMGPGVTSIGTEAFTECSALYKVQLSDTLTDIGTDAFSHTGITSIVIPAGITHLPERAFLSCSQLSDITLPSGILTIGDSAFADCTSLESITLLGGLKIIGNSAFSGCTSLKYISLPEGLETIDNSAFINCTSLESIIVPDGLKVIGEAAFSDCTSLKNVTLPGGLETIDRAAFMRCTALESIAVPNGPKTIGRSAFAGCTMLTVASFPEGVTSIAEYAFFECIALTSITLADSITFIGERALGGCYALTNLKLPDSLKELSGKYWFKDTGISYLVIPSGMETIGEFAFNGTRNSPFQTIIVSDGVKRIEWAALADNDKLVKVVLPASITYLGRDVFNICPNLTELHYEGTKAQWESISKEAYWNGAQSNLAVIHCSDGDIPIQ